MTPDTPDDAAGLWLSISELAAHKRVTKQTVSAKVARLVADGLLVTKAGPGRQKLINLAQYDTAIGDVGDGAKEQGATTKRENATQTVPRSSDGGKFRDEQTREKAYSADLKEIELQQKRGNLLVVAEFDAVAADAAGRIAEIVDGLLSLESELTAVATKEGENGMRAALKRIVRQQRTDIVEAMKEMALTARARAKAAATGMPAQIDMPLAPIEE